MSKTRGPLRIAALPTGGRDAARVVEMLEDLLARAKAGQFTSLHATLETADGLIMVCDQPREGSSTADRAGRILGTAIDMMVRHRLSDQWHAPPPAPDGGDHGA